MSDADTVVKVHVGGRDHAVQLPNSLCEREELFVAWQEHGAKGTHKSLRVAAALVGACTRVGRLAGVTYDECGFEPLRFGGRVYDWLRTQPGGLDGLASAARAVSDELVTSLRALTEAKARADFSAAPEARSTVA